MTGEPTQTLDQAYTDLLRRFCASGDVGLFAEVGELARTFIAAGVAPMEIKTIHEGATADVVDPDDAEGLVAAHRLLLELLFAYGAAYSVLSEQLLADADEAEQVRAEGVQHAEQDRLSLLAGVSHELGNPLMVVKGNVASIRRFLEERGNWPEDLNTRQADIEFALERMIALREELLAASRNEQPELNIMAVPITPLLRRVSRWAQLSASEKSIRITEEYSPDLPYVMADDGALQSIFGNLLSNAIRYTGKGGAVTIRAYTDGSMVSVEVSDTGIGISEEEQLRIYERFYRTDEAKKTVAFGIGLGLAITRDLVSSLAGTIELNSQVGVGSTFKVSLPVAQDTEKDEA